MVLATAAGWATRYRLFDGGWLKSISQNLMLLENSREVVAIRCGVLEGVFSSFCVEEAAHGIELTKVKSENFCVSCSMGVGLEML